MKAVLLSGGLGTRLKPITDYVPKPLVPINNVPILEWQIRYLKRFGVKNIVICAGYKSEQIIHFLEMKKNFGINVDISIEKNALGTGGAIRNAKKLIGNDGDFFVLNGDVITNIDLCKVTNYDSQSLSKSHLIAVVPLKSTFGVVEIVDDKVANFKEKPVIQGKWINAGIYYLRSEIIDYLPKKGNIETTTFPLFAIKGCLRPVKFEDGFFWHSIDSHKDVEYCSKDMEKNNYLKFIYRSVRRRRKS